MIMKSSKSFGIFADLWDDDDPTTSIAWGLCGYRGARTEPGGKAPIRKMPAQRRKA
jgi:hypothetical protein